MLKLAPAQDVRLVMPRLGHPVEPSRVEHVDTWWRGVAKEERAVPKPEPEPEPLDASVPFPLD